MTYLAKLELNQLFRRQQCYFETWEKVITELLILELNNQRLIIANMHETEQNMSYDMITYINLLKKLAKDRLYSNVTIKWNEHEKLSKIEVLSSKKLFK